MVSVCMPIYNAAPFLRMCIDSILNQSFDDFELIIVDDGSTDESVDIVLTYTDSRIKLIRNRHNYIESLNRSIAEAVGKYIARMDSDDVMPIDRLKTQYAFMEEHPEIDVLSGALAMFRESPNNIVCDVKIQKGFVTLGDIADSCCIGHPTVMLRRESVSPIVYSQEMVYAEDYDLWVSLLSKGKVFYQLDKVFVYYRLHEGQISSSHSKEQQQKTLLIRKQALYQLHKMTTEALYKPEMIPSTTNRLTVIIPFLNEGEEVRNTILSIRATAGNSADIIVINDASDDQYDYEGDLRDLQITYIRNSYRLGAALSKEKGVQLSKTPYFILLDAHMRFYDKGWVDYIIKELDQNSHRLLCAQTIFLKKEKDGEVSIHASSKVPHGAFLAFGSNKHVPSIDWNYHTGKIPFCVENQIPSILGAGYISSKNYWNKIRGLQGLIHYGCEEAYLSIKAWMEGSGCYLLPNLSIGHIYRDTFPYKVYSFQYMYNHLFISELLFPTSAKFHARYIAWNLGHESFDRAMEYMETVKDLSLKLKEYYASFSGFSFSHIQKMNKFCYEVTHEEDHISAEEAEKVMNYIKEHHTKDSKIGIFNGLSSIFLAVLLYAECGHPEYEQIAINLWNKITNELSNNHNLSFRTGLSGVGWTLIYSVSQGLIEDDIDADLSLIDKHIETICLRRVTDLSFWDGLGGIYCYVVARLGFDKRNGKRTLSFSSEFLSEMEEEALRVNQASDDWRTKSYTSQFLERRSEDWMILSPNLGEIIDLPNYIPKSISTWDLTLSGVIGSVINKLIYEYEIKHEKEPV